MFKQLKKSCIVAHIFTIFKVSVLWCPQCPHNSVVSFSLASGTSLNISCCAGLLLVNFFSFLFKKSSLFYVYYWKKNFSLGIKSRVTVFSCNTLKIFFFTIFSLALFLIRNVLSSIFFEHFLIYGSIRYYKLILYISCPSHRMKHFSKETLFLLLENYIRNKIEVQSFHSHSLLSKLHKHKM